MTQANKEYNKLTTDDILELNEIYGETFYTSGDALRVIEHYGYDILHDARKLGWNDWEVRERMYESMRSLRIDTELYE